MGRKKWDKVGIDSKKLLLAHSDLTFLCRSMTLSVRFSLLFSLRTFWCHVFVSKSQQRHYFLLHPKTQFPFLTGKVPLNGCAMYSLDLCFYRTFSDNFVTSLILQLLQECLWCHKGYVSSLRSGQNILKICWVTCATMVPFIFTWLSIRVINHPCQSPHKSLIHQICMSLMADNRSLDDDRVTLIPLHFGHIQRKCVSFCGRTAPSMGSCSDCSEWVLPTQRHMLFLFIKSFSPV